MAIGFTRYFLAPWSAQRLGFCRVFFYLWCLFQVWFYAPWAYARLPQELWAPPFVVAVTGPPSEAALLATCGLLVPVLLLCAVGRWTRFMAPLAALGLTYSFGVVCSYGFISFHHSPLVLIAWVLAFSRCGDALSLDARGQSQAAPSPEYCWPVRCACLVLVVLMFSAGFHKTMGGWWTNPVSNIEYFLRFKLTAHADQKGLVMGSWMSTPLAYPGLMAVMGWATVALELFAPLAMLDRPAWIRLVLIGGLFAMQATLASMATLVSFPWLAAYVFWIPWPTGGESAA